MEGKNVSGSAYLVINNKVSRIEITDITKSQGGGITFMVTDATGNTSFSRTLNDVGDIIIPSNVNSVRIGLSAGAAPMYDDYWLAANVTATFNVY